MSILHVPQPNASPGIAIAPVFGPAVSKRIEARGPFLFRGDEKFTAKGVTYGPFKPNGRGEFFPEPDRARADLALMRGLGLNAARLYYPPPAWFADMAGDAGISLLVGIPWPEHICGLGESRFERNVRKSIRDAVARLRGHPAIMGYLVGNEIPTMNVRWQGAEMVERFLGDLYDAAKSEDPEALVSYANYPSTEYLSLARHDFYTLNVYLHKRETFRAYLARVRNLAGNKPFILGEFGIDAIREGEAHQAEILSFSLDEAARSGVAGAFVFSFTDEWFRGGAEVEGWAFGVTTRDRQIRPAAQALCEAANRPHAVPMPRYPKVSVVVATYNGGATLRETLTTLGKMTYPDFEVIVIDDGSTDDSAAIAREFFELPRANNGSARGCAGAQLSPSETGAERSSAPGREPAKVKLIQQTNRGLSAARNRGIEAATGEIIAYCDSDVAVDPDWLYYLVATMGTERGPIGGSGGPNLPPPGDGPVAAAVAASPGGPTHVLVDDVTAEHIPGCNMAFWKSALVEVGGFDPRFRAAGDDVDICWRLQDRGLKLGYAPSAIVWHHRRNSARAYLKQQRGYGEAEAELAAKHPGRYNAFGGAIWRGRIYAGIQGDGPLISRPRIHYGVFGQGLFQTIYQPDEPLLIGLATTPEGTIVGALSLLGGLIAGKLGLAIFGALLIAAPIVFALKRAWLATLEPQYAGLKTRTLIFCLSMVQPWIRRVAQLRTARSLRHRVLVNESLRAAWFGQGGGQVSGFWSEDGGERESFLGNLETSLTQDRFPVHRGDGFETFDLEVGADEGARSVVSTVMEYHGGPKRLLRVRVEHALSRGAAAALIACGIGAASLFSVSQDFGIVAGIATLGGLYHFRRRGRWLQNAVEARIAEVARKLGFSPVPAPRDDKRWYRVLPTMLSSFL